VRATLIPLTVALLLVTTVRADEPEIDPHFGSQHTALKDCPDPKDFPQTQQFYSSEEMEAMSDLVINGRVETKEDTLDQVDSLAPYQFPGEVPEHVMHAVVQVLHTFKGMAMADQIDFRFRATAPGFSGSLGSLHVLLAPDHRYRFFLKKDESGHGYVGVIDGKIDDQWDVQSLGPDEADDAPYLTCKDALALARAYYDSLKPPPLAGGVSFITGKMFAPQDTRGGAIWTVDFDPKVSTEKVFTVQIQDGKASTYGSNSQ
jgi:hypothetical protein